MAETAARLILNKIPSDLGGTERTNDQPRRSTSRHRFDRRNHDGRIPAAQGMRDPGGQCACLPALSRDEASLHDSRPDAQRPVLILADEGR